MAGSYGSPIFCYVLILVQDATHRESQDIQEMLSVNMPGEHQEMAYLFGSLYPQGISRWSSCF